MKTYIRKNINGYYTSFNDEIDTEYWKGKIGYTYEDFINGKWILLSDEQVLFHKEYPVASIKEVLDMKIASSNERTLEDAKKEMINKIIAYDQSRNVNSFTINGQSMWLTREERTQIDESIRAYEDMGQIEMTKYFNNIPYTFSLVEWKQMLNKLIIYASEAFNITESHKAAVNTLDSIEAVDAYDYTINYPSKLIF